MSLKDSDPVKFGCLLLMQLLSPKVAEGWRNLHYLYGISKSPGLSFFKRGTPNNKMQIKTHNA